MAERPQLDQPKSEWGLLLVLLILAALPRICMAYSLDTICPDGTYYIDVAKVLESGQLAAPRGHYDFNVYPLVLALMHQAGIGYELSAKLWGVLCGTLVVLPLFGWVRRQYDQSMAVVACIFYAVHPKLIEWTPEVVRESTFWLMFATAVYLLFRAMSEVRLALFALGGIFVTLASMTRFEGWFLCVPVCLWFGFRWQALVEARRRLVLGMVLLVSMIPLTLMGLTLLHGYEDWQWGDFNRLRSACGFAAAVVEDVIPQEEVPVAPQAEPEPEPAPEVAPVAVSTNPADPNFQMPNLPQPLMQESRTSSVPVRLWFFAHTLERGFTSVFGILMLVGHAVWWRLWLRRDNLALFLMCLCVLGGVWIHLSLYHGVSSRYITILVIQSTPFAALGLFSIVGLATQAIDRLFRLSTPSWLYAGTFSTALATLMLLGTFDALGNHYDGRHAVADLGHWLHDELGPGRTMVGSSRWQSANYYAHGTYAAVGPEFGVALQYEVLRLVSSHHPDAIVLYRKQISGREIRALLELPEWRGYSWVPTEHLPDSCQDKVVVLLREDDFERVVRNPRRR